MKKQYINNKEKKNEILFENIKIEMIKQLKNIKYTGHLDDLGNEIGIAIGTHIAHKKNLFFTKQCFIDGFNHGISLTDGTH